MPLPPFPDDQSAFGDFCQDFRIVALGTAGGTSAAPYPSISGSGSIPNSARSVSWSWWRAGSLRPKVP